MNLRQIFAIITMLAASIAQGQEDWPSKPIHIIVPSAAGGAADFLARNFARYFTEQTKQAAVVENRPGAGSIIGAQIVKASAPDGYTYLLSGMSTQAANSVLYTNLSYDPPRDFDEIGMFGLFPMIGLVRKGSALSSVAEIVSYAKAHPDKLTFGYHAASALIPVELIKARTGIIMTGVPYKNVTQISLDIISGLIDFAFIDALSAAPALKNGSLMPIAVTSANRVPSMPTVPTVAEVLPGYVMDGWLGLSAPAGTPRYILERMNRVLRGALSDSVIKARLEGQGLIPNGLTLEEQKIWVQEDRRRWVEWVRIAKIEPQQQ
ncbi:MAG: tripartite tricarboxylate transporter substrate binding protein [Alcaligenaceae bacterium]